MIGAILQEKNFIACALAAITPGRAPVLPLSPFPKGISSWNSSSFGRGRYRVGFEVFLHHCFYPRRLTSFIRSFSLWILHLYLEDSSARPKAGKPPARYPTTPKSQQYLFLVLGEVHNPRSARALGKHPTGSRFQNVVYSPGSPSSAQLAVERQGLLYPYAEQILSYEATMTPKNGSADWSWR